MYGQNNRRTDEHHAYVGLIKDHLNKGFLLYTYKTTEQSSTLNVLLFVFNKHW